MIQAKDLRLGNYILDYEAEPNKTPYWRVEAIHEDGVEYRNLSCWTLDGHIQPIPLTEEILLKCGFEKVNKIFFIKGALTVEIQSFGHFRVSFDGKMLVNLKHLHQLENLYFALTNQELNIEL